MNAPTRMTDITMTFDMISPHERAARAHDAAAEAHERAEALVERTIADPSEDNEIIEVQQCSDAFQASTTAHEATVEANQLGGLEKGAELSSDAALHEAHAAGGADAGSEDALKRHHPRARRGLRKSSIRRIIACGETPGRGMRPCEVPFRGLPSRLACLHSP